MGWELFCKRGSPPDSAYVVRVTATGGTEGVKDTIGIRDVMLDVPVFPPTGAWKAFRAGFIWFIYVGGAAALALLRYLLDVSHDVIIFLFVVGVVLPVGAWLFWTWSIARAVQRSLPWKAFIGDGRFRIERRGVVADATGSMRIAWMRLGTPPDLYCSMAFVEVRQRRVVRAHHVAVQGRQDWALQLWKQPIETWHLSEENVRTWEARAVHQLGLPPEIGSADFAPEAPPRPASAELVESDGIAALRWLDRESNVVSVSVHDSVEDAKAQRAWEAGVAEGDADPGTRLRDDALNTANEPQRLVAGRAPPRLLTK